MRISSIRKEENTQKYVCTPQRKLILDTLQSLNGLVDARKIFQLVSQKDSTISLATVYRTLNLFKELKLIDEHHFKKTSCCYELTRSPEHQHIMCKSCEKVIDFESPLITDLIQKLQSEKDFYIDKVEICIQGICGECRKKLNPKDIEDD